MGLLIHRICELDISVLVYPVRVSVAPLAVSPAGEPARVTALIGGFYSDVKSCHLNSLRFRVALGAPLTRRLKVGEAGLRTEVG